MPPVSDDGRFWWDGNRWQSLYSADGRFRWNGQAWLPVSQPLAATAEPATARTASATAGRPEAPPAFEREAAPDHSDAAPAEPRRPVAGGGIDWNQEIAPSKPMAGGIDWSAGVAPAVEVAVVGGEVVDRPNWLASDQRYDERFLAAPTSGDAPVFASQPFVAPWRHVPGAQRSRIIPIIGAGVVAILALAWVASSAGVVVTGPDLPFLSRDQGNSVSAAPTPRPTPKPPPAAVHYPRAGERYAAVVGADGTRLNVALAAVTATCSAGAAPDQCRPAALAALTVVQSYRRDLVGLPVPTCAVRADAALERGLLLYEQGLGQMAVADNAHPDLMAAGQATFDLGSKRLVEFQRLMDGIDPSICR